MDALLTKHNKYGASDMGTGILEWLYQKTKEGKKVVIKPSTWELFSSEPGWEIAAQELTDEANKINQEFLNLFN